MSLSDLIFGRFLDWSMSSKVIARERPAALEAAHGEVLELGFDLSTIEKDYPQLRSLKRVIAVPHFIRLRNSRDRSAGVGFY